MITNHTNIPLSLAVWLAHDDYDYIDDPTVISATSLLKPIRSIVLERQNMELMKMQDVSAMVPSRMGTAIHDAIEKAWTSKMKLADILSKMGYPEDVITRIKINPEPAEIQDDSIVIYMEQRATKEICGFKVTGKFDFCMEGTLEDFKSTGVYNYISGSNKEKYRQQMSIYRWLNQDKVTSDQGHIRYIFTDWSALKAIQDKKYPSSRLVDQTLDLMSLHETEEFIRDILDQVNLMMDWTQDVLPECNREELWQKPDVFKYYKDPSKKQRATKNFNTYAEAHERLLKDNSVGEIVSVPGSINRCKYCNVVGICDQAQQFINNGSLVL